MAHTRFVPVAVLASIAVGAPAFGHTAAVTSSPRQGAVVATVPTRVVVTFAEALLRVESATVTRRAGGQIARSAVVNPRDRRQLVITTAGGRPGRYAVAYVVVGADAHRVSGRLRFTVRPGG